MYSVKCFPFVAIKQNCLHSPLHNSLECLVHIAYYMKEPKKYNFRSNNPQIIYEELETIEVPHFESKTLLFRNQKD